MDCSGIIFFFIILSFIGSAIKNSKKKDKSAYKQLAQNNKPQNSQENVKKNSSKKKKSKKKSNKSTNKNASQQIQRNVEQAMNQNVTNNDSKDDNTFYGYDMASDIKFDYGFVTAENLLKDIEFPDVLNAGMNYTYVPDTLPNFEMPNIASYDIGTRSEAHEE